VIVYCSDKNVSHAADKINGALLSLDSWLDHHGLSLSSSKSSAIVFSRSRSSPACQIVFKEEPIPLVDSVKFLGVIFDRRFQGVPHLTYIARKCEKNLNMLRALSGAWWGAHPYSQKLLYNAFIRSHLDFGTFIFEPCNKAALSILETIQAKALRLVTGAMKSSPNRAVQVECVDPPLDLRRQLLSDRYLFGISSQSSHPLLPKLRLLQLYGSTKAFWRNKEKPNLVQSLEKIATFKSPIMKSRSLPLYSVPFESLMHSPNVITNTGIDKKSPMANSIFTKYANSRFQGYSLFFTDASKLTDQGCVGAAFLLANTHILAKFKLPPDSSVFSGECLALMKTMEYILAHKINKSAIFSDCLSALQSISLRPFNNFARNFFICQLKDISYKCHSAGLEVVFVWIPSHSGILGNERVDRAAKEAVLDGDDSFFKIYSPDISNIPFRLINKKWMSRWTRSKKCFFSLIQPTIPCRPWFFKNRSLSKRHTSVIIRLRLGRVCSPEQLHKFRIKGSPMCECGEEIGTAEHIFFKCPLNNKTLDLYSQLAKLSVPLPINIPSLLCLIDNKKVVCALGKFIAKNNIKL
jgi:ribonuclease HI